MVKLDVRSNTGSAAGLNIGDLVTAPALGCLTRTKVQVGSYLSRGAPVAVLQNWSRLHILYRLPAPLAKHLVLGQRLMVKVLDFSNRLMLAQGYQLTQARPTQAVLVLRIDSPDANPALRPGKPVRLLYNQPPVAGGPTVAGR